MAFENIVDHETQILIDKWYDWAEGFLGKSITKRINIVDTNGSTVPMFHLLTSDGDVQGKLHAKFEDMVKELQPYHTIK
jgi:hypothetical protein